ncbi:MAG: OB-fold nucleic acid binding domain-containing protein, partial [Actinomycetota bacterium]
MTGQITLRDLAAIDVKVLKGVGDKRKAALAEYGVENVLELLMNYPRRWVDRTNEARVSDLVAGQEALVLVEVRKVSKFTTKSRKTIVKVQVGDESGRISATFFNQPWRERQLKVGLQVAMFGKVDEFRGALQMNNPLVDLIGDRTGRIVPIYPQSEKTQVSTWELATWVENALERCRERGIADPLPESLLNEYDLMARGPALWSIHFPDSMVAKQNARRRLAFDELLRVQVVLVGRQRSFELDTSGLRHVDGEKLRR